MNLNKYLQKFFKAFFYKLFLSFYGRVKYKPDFITDNILKTDVIETSKNQIYKIYSIKNCRLYTDRIFNMAIIKNDTIIDGPSFQLKDNININVNQNIVLMIGTPRKLRKIKGTVASLLTGGGGNYNYHHWLYDVLPRLYLISKKVDLNSIDFFLVPSIEKNFQLETLELLGIKNKSISSKNYRHILADKIYVTDHPWLKENPPQDQLDYPNWIIDYLRGQFIKKISNEENKNLPKKIFIDREDSTANHAIARKLINKNEVYEFYKKNNFSFIQLGKLKFTEQVKLFNNADFIAGQHGSGLANLVFCKSKTRVVEFRTYNTGKLYENIGKKNNVNYKAFEYEPVNYKGSVQLGHISVPLSDMEQSLID